jgi:hypothetical protein
MDYNNGDDYSQEITEGNASTIDYNNKIDYNVRNQLSYNLNNEYQMEYEEEEEEEDEEEDEDYLFNRSCIEPLLLEKIKNPQENDYSYLRRTMSANDISRYERQYVISQEQQQYEEDEEDEERMEREIEMQNSNHISKRSNEEEMKHLSHSHEMKDNSNRIDKENENDNLQYDQMEAFEKSDNLNETPIKNVSHISEVSKSKENSDQQYHNKLNSNNSKPKEQNNQDNEINNEYFNKNNNHSHEPNQHKEEEVNNNEQTHSIITYNEKEKSSIVNEDSIKHGNNYDNDNDNDYDESQNQKYIGDRYDYYDDDDSMEINDVSLAHSVPPLQRNINLSQPTESIDSYQQQMQGQYDDEQNEYDDESKEEKISYPNTSSHQLPDIDASSNQNVITNHEINASNLSNLSKHEESITSKKNKEPAKKTTISSNKSFTNKKNKQNYQVTKSSNQSLLNGTRSDISKSSSLSNQIQNGSNHKSNKSSSISLLDETPLSDSEVKNELIKMAKKIYGKKLNAVQLKQISYLFNLIVYELKEALQAYNNKNKTEENEVETEKPITKEFLLLHEKQLHTLLVNYIESNQKQNNLKNKTSKTFDTNTFVIKHIREDQYNILEEKVKRKQQELEVNSKIKTMNCYKSLDFNYRQALFNEEQRCGDEMKRIEIKRIKAEEEKNKLLGENIKYFSDKIGILSYMLMREQKKNNIDKQRKEMFLEVLKKKNKYQKRRIFDEFIERINEEDRNEEYKDNNQEQIQNLVNKYYPKK